MLRLEILRNIWNSGLRLGVILAAGVACNAFAGDELGNGEEEAIRIIQASSFNLVTGNWDVSVPLDGSSIASDFKRELPKLDYHLVDEETVRKGGSDRIVLTFRGVGDQRVVVKLKEMEGATNVRLRVGLAGSEAKSAELFRYVFLRM